MRAPTALWVASLAIVGIQGPGFTTAEAAPTPHSSQSRLKPRYFVPRRVRRQLLQDTPAINDTSPLFPGLGPDPASDSTSTEVITSTAMVVPQPVPDPSPASQPSSSSNDPLLSVVPAIVSQASLPASVPSDPPLVQQSASSALSSVVVPPAVIPLSDPSSGAVPPVVVPASPSSAPSSSPSVSTPFLGPVLSLLSPSPSPSPSYDGSTATSDGIIVGLNTIISSAASLVSSLPAVIDPSASALPTSGIVPLDSGVGTAVTVPSAAPTDTLQSPGGLSAVASLLSSMVQPSDSGTPGLPLLTQSSSPSSTTPLIPLVVPVPSATVSLPGSLVTTLSETPPPVGVPTGSGVPTSLPVSLTTPVVPPPDTQTTTSNDTIASQGPATNAPVQPTSKSDTSATSAPLVTPEVLTSAPPTQNTVVPTATDTNTQMTLPTAILVQPSNSGVVTPAAATGIPTSMPKLIQPPGGKPNKPSNTTLVQLGFYHELNYAFVSTNSQSASQIFEFLPNGIGYGIGSGDATMQSIQPYDTSKSLGYITTLALMYIPSDLVNRLSVDLHTPNSGIYQNPDATVATLMGLINPSIPLLAGQSVGDGSSSGSSASAAASPGSTNGANPFGSDAANNEPVRTSSVTIVAPVAAGALLYGSAMVFVARRYKKRRQNHQRTSSVSGGSTWMTGPHGPQLGAANRDSHGSGNTSGRSVRTQQISAPVTSENSLGWN